MALDIDRLTDAIDAEMADLVSSYATSPDRDTVKNGMFKAIAKAVIEEFQANAELVGDDSGGDSHEDVSIG